QAHANPGAEPEWEVRRPRLARRGLVEVAVRSQPALGLERLGLGPKPRVPMERPLARHAERPGRQRPAVELDVTERATAENPRRRPKPHRLREDGAGPREAVEERRGAGPCHGGWRARPRREVR